VFFAKDHKTRDMFDPLARFGPHRRSRLEKSWAKLFREEILPVLPVHKLSPRYSGVTGSPTKDLYAMLGIMLLQQMHDLTDEETASFRDRYRYRAGIEGAFSALDRLTGVKQLRVRGMDAVRYCVTLKAAGVNLFRAVAVWNPKRGGESAGSPRDTGIRGLRDHVLPRIVCLARRLHIFFVSCLADHSIPAASAA
jgi:hypothetical protein